MSEVSRSEVRLFEQAVRNRWEIPEAVFKIMPQVMVKLLASGTPREQIAAARVLAAIHQQNTAPVTNSAPVVNVGVQVNGNPDGGRITATAIAERIRIGRMAGNLTD